MSRFEKMMESYLKCGYICQLRLVRSQGMELSSSLLCCMMIYFILLKFLDYLYNCLVQALNVFRVVLCIKLSAMLHSGNTNRSAKKVFFFTYQLLLTGLSSVSARLLFAVRGCKFR